MVLAQLEQVPLLIEYRQGKPLREMVHAEHLGRLSYRLRYSPGFVQGIAAGDEFVLLNADGGFQVTRWAGNLAVQVLSRESVQGVQAYLTEQVRSLGGTLDGYIDQGLVFTIPGRAGVEAIDALFSAFAAEYPSLVWSYGNPHALKRSVEKRLESRRFKQA